MHGMGSMRLAAFGTFRVNVAVGKSNEASMAGMQAIPKTQS
jgi:hypothetical protein